MRQRGWSPAPGRSPGLLPPVGMLLSWVSRVKCSPGIVCTHSSPNCGSKGQLLRGSLKDRKQYDIMALESDAS